MPSRYPIYALTLASLWSVGCEESEPHAGDDRRDQDPEECGGHGHLHDDHCDCDAGYEPAEDETVCVAENTHAGEEARLLVSDGEKGRVAVVDLAEAEVLDVLETEGPARVYADSTARWGFAVQGADDVVQGIDPGLEYVSHGDHFDVEENDPGLLSDVVVSCSRPVHFVAHDGWGAAFCDGDGMLHIFDEKEVGGTVETTSFDSGRPHHGVGLVAFDRVILSTPNPDDEEDSLPIGVRALSLDGEEEASFAECPGLHGEAATHTHVCFGCSDGVLCVHENSAGELRSTKIDNPDGAEDLRVGTLSAAATRLVGNWGEDLVWIDLAEATLRPIEVGKQVLKFSVARDGQSVFVLAADGSLTTYGLPNGKPLEKQDVMPEFTLEPGHGQLRPTFVLGAQHAYLVDPRSTEVLEIALDDLTPTERLIQLPKGAYHSAAWIGMRTDHDEDDDH